MATAIRNGSIDAPMFSATFMPIGAIRITGGRVVDHGGQQHCCNEHASKHRPGRQGAAQLRESGCDPRRAARRFQRLTHRYHCPNRTMTGQSMAS